MTDEEFKRELEDFADYVGSLRLIKDRGLKREMKTIARRWLNQLMNDR